ncbi:hypothetical protein TWF281_007678 [Arthrobotrys megalospora]
MLKAVWIVLTAITLFISVFSQSTFLTVFSGSSIGTRNAKIKISAIRTSTSVVRMVRKRQTGAQSSSQATSSLETSTRTSSTSERTGGVGGESSTGATLQSDPTSGPTGAGTGTNTGATPTGTETKTGAPPTGTGSGDAGRVPTGFPSWAYAVLIPVLVAMCGGVLAANCIKRRRKSDQEPIPTPPLPIASPPENHNEKFLGNIRALTSNDAAAAPRQQ